MGHVYQCHELCFAYPGRLWKWSNPTFPNRKHGLEAELAGHPPFLAPSVYHDPSEQRAIASCFCDGHLLEPELP